MQDGNSENHTTRSGSMNSPERLNAPSNEVLATLQEALDRLAKDPPMGKS